MHAIRWIGVSFGTWVLFPAMVCAEPPEGGATMPYSEDAPRVKVILTTGPALHRVMDGTRLTELHIAARDGQEEVVRFLLKSGADVNARTGIEPTPLHVTRDPKVVKLLASHGANLEATLNEETALEHAAFYAGRVSNDPKHASWQLVKALREAGARYTLLAAVRLGDIDSVRRFLIDEPRLARSPDLMRDATIAGHAEVIRLMLSHGADHTDANYGGLPLLYFAVDHPEIVRALLDAGADPNRPLEYHGSGAGPAEGTTLLHRAGDRGQAETARMLIAHGAEVDAKTWNGATPLHYAASEGHSGVVKLLVECGADVAGKSGDFAMKCTAARLRPAYSDRQRQDNERRIEVIKYLAKLGVPIDEKTAITLRTLEATSKIVPESDR